MTNQKALREATAGWGDRAGNFARPLKQALKESLSKPQFAPTGLKPSDEVMLNASRPKPKVRRDG